MINEQIAMNATFRLVLGAGVLTIASALPAEGQIVTDRPDFTESTATVPDGHFQIEAGYTWLDIDEFTAHEIGEGLLRYGIIPGLEARLGIPSYISAGFDDAADDEDFRGFGDASAGIKLGLHEAGMAEGLPSVSVLLGTTIPTGSEDVDAGHGWEPEAVLALGWEFAPRLELGANVGYAQRVPFEDERIDEFLGSVALGVPVTSSLGAFIEYFAIRPDVDDEAEADEDYIDGGVTFLLNPTFQLDARVGIGIGDSDDAMFFGVGLAKLF